MPACGPLTLDAVSCLQMLAPHTSGRNRRGSLTLQKAAFWISNLWFWGAPNYKLTCSKLSFIHIRLSYDHLPHSSNCWQEREITRINVLALISLDIEDETSNRIEPPLGRDPRTIQCYLLLLQNRLLWATGSFPQLQSCWHCSLGITLLLSASGLVISC